MYSGLNMQALYSDETSGYRRPAEPETGDMVTIRFRTARKDVDAVFLISSQLRIRMNKTRSEGFFDYYGVSIPVGEETVFLQ